MPRIEQQIEIAARPTTAFRFCHDMARRPEWDERITGAEVLTPKPIRRGSVVRFDTQLGAGAVFSWEGELAEFTFPSRSRIDVIDAAPSSHFVDGSERWSFTRSGDGTQLSLLWEYRPRGIVGRILDVLMRRRTIRRAIVQSLHNLKRAIESEA
jgi:uncharacterized membrane protein